MFKSSGSVSVYGAFASDSGVPTPPDAVPDVDLEGGDQALEGQVALPVDAEDDYERLQKLRDTC